MSPVNYLETAEQHYHAQQEHAEDVKAVDGQPSFFSSMNARGYLFILLVVFYIFGVTLFYFSQREQHIEQLAEYHKIQHAQQALNQADLAAFHVVTVLFSEVTQAELIQVVAYFNTLRQHYVELQSLFPEQAATFSQLLQSLPSTDMAADQDALRAIHFHLAKSKNELERLKLINQQRMQQLVITHDRNRDAHIINTLALAIAGLIILGTLTTLFFHRLKRDLLALQVRTGEIVNGFRGSPLAVSRHDELGQLTAGINSLSQSLAAREYDLEVARRRASFHEKMVAIDALAGGIAHEIGNPLACIAGLTRDVIDDRENRFSDSSRDSLEQIQQSITGLEKITRDISYLDIQTQDQPDWLDLNNLIDNTIKIFQYDSRYSSITIDYEHNAELSAVYIANDLLVLLLTNLIENALDAASHEKQPNIQISSRQPDADHVCLWIEDNGQGVDTDKLDKIFEAFYTTKALGQGTGLGLAICWSICSAIGGGITAAPSSLGGLRVEVILPVKPTESTPTAARDSL